jgi:hypothetical protein
MPANRPGKREARLFPLEWPSFVVHNLPGASFTGVRRTDDKTSGSVLSTETRGKLLTAGGLVAEE